MADQCFGTLNVLESLRKLKNDCNVVIITSDKCYFNREIHYGYKETDILGGKDPYSGSKASAELLVKSYISSFFSTVIKQKFVLLLPEQVMLLAAEIGQIIELYLIVFDLGQKIEKLNYVILMPQDHGNMYLRPWVVIYV